MLFLLFVLLVLSHDNTEIFLFLVFLLVLSHDSAYKQGATGCLNNRSH